MFVSISDGATEGIGKVISGTRPVLNPVAGIAAINGGVGAMNNSIKTWNAGNTPSGIDYFFLAALVGGGGFFQGGHGLPPSEKVI